MKHTLLLNFLLFISAIGWAQSPITIEPNPIDAAFSEDLSDEFLDLEIYAKITNTTNEEVSLKWTRIVNEKPSAWQTQVCDNLFCYLPAVSTNVDENIGLNEPFVLEAGESFDLILHVLPNGMEGEGDFELVFALTSAPEMPIDTARFFAKVTNNTTTSVFNIAHADIRLYPNPATDYFELTNATAVERVVVYNLLGREVRAYSASRGEQYNLHGLPDGLYLVSLQNRGKALKTLRLNKRSWRP